MQILWYFHAWTKDSTKPITLWVEAKNHESARNAIMRENPYINRLMFIRTNVLTKIKELCQTGVTQLTSASVIRRK